VFGNKKGLERKLTEQGGTVAWATVIDSGTRWTSGTNYENGPYTVGNKSHMKVELKVEPEGEPAFESSFKQVFPGKIPIKDFQVKVIFDPSDHSKIAILEDQIFPPGISHEQAEVAAARDKRRKEAAKSGKMAEFLEQDIAARKAEAAAGGAESAGVFIDRTGFQGTGERSWWARRPRAARAPRSPTSPTN